MGNKLSKDDFQNGNRNASSHASPQLGRVATGHSLGSSFASPASETRRFDLAPSNSATSAQQPQPGRPQFYQNSNDPERDLQLSRNIASISQLLREMYSLDLKIFGSASDRAEYDGERMAMIEQADLLFARITTTLEHWAAHSDWWTEEEWDAIDKIRFSASRHDPRRHRKKETKRETGPVFATHEMSAFKFDAAKYDAQELEAWERPRYGTHELEAPERA